MVKVDFTKVEQAFERSLNQVTITDIQISSAWKNLIEGNLVYKGTNPDNNLNNKIIQKILLSITTRMKQLSTKDPEYYTQLMIEPNEETKYAASPENLTKEDWIRLLEIREKMDGHIQSNQPDNADNPEDSSKIQDQVKEHVHKRFNVKKGWLPL